MNNIWPAHCWNERTKKSDVSQQLQLLLIRGYRVYAWAQGNAHMEGGLSLCALCVVGWSLLKKPFSLPGTDLQGSKSSLGVKDKMALQELHSLAEGTTKHRATLGRGVSVTPPLSPHSLDLKRKTALLHLFTQNNSPHLALYFSPWEKSGRGSLLSCTHLDHGRETSCPLSCAVTSLVLWAGEQR